MVSQWWSHGATPRIGEERIRKNIEISTGIADFRREAGFFIFAQTRIRAVLVLSLACCACNGPMRVAHRTGLTVFETDNQARLSYAVVSSVTEYAARIVARGIRVRTERAKLLQEFTGAECGQ